jgi:hypothetical protein
MNDQASKCGAIPRRMLLSIPLVPVLGITPLAQSQNPSGPPGGWWHHRVRRLKPGKRAEFEKLYSDVIRKYHLLRKEAGLEKGWVLAKLVFPAGEDAPFHYSSNTWHDTAPNLDPDPSLNEAIYRKMDMTADQFMTRLDATSTLVRTSVTVRLETVGTIEKGDFARVDFMKVKPGRGAEYVGLERTIYKPLREERVKSGHLKAWALNAVVYPSGAERPYDFYTINASKDSAGLQGALGNAMEMFPRIHPGKNFVAIQNQTNEVRTLVNGYVYRILEVTS